MGNKTSSENDSNNNQCGHGWNSDSMRYDHQSRDNHETIHYKNEYNSAADRTESFSPAGEGPVSSIVQSFLDGNTLRNSETHIKEGCGECKDK